MSVSQAVYEAMVERLADRDEEITRLRAEVKRRGEMLRRANKHLPTARRAHDKIGEFDEAQDCLEVLMSIEMEIAADARLFPDPKED